MCGWEDGPATKALVTQGKKPGVEISWTHAKPRCGHGNGEVEWEPLVLSVSSGFDWEFLLWKDKMQTWWGRLLTLVSGFWEHICMCSRTCTCIYVKNNDGQSMFLKSVKLIYWLWKHLVIQLSRVTFGLYYVRPRVKLLKLNNQQRAWGDGSVRDMLPEFDPQHLCTNASCSGTQMQSQCWGGRNRHITGACWAAIPEPGSGIQAQRHFVSKKSKVEGWAG